MTMKNAVPVLLGATAVLGQLQTQPKRARRFRVSPIDEIEGTKKANNVESMFSDSLPAQDTDFDELEMEFIRVLRNAPMSMSMDHNPCLPDDVSPFRIEDDTDIGDRCADHGGGARKCGNKSCYRVQDNGDDPPYDPEEGDTLRFAYREVSSNKFSFEAKVCGAGGDSGKGCRPSKEGSWEGYGRCGRIGLNIRESLDPFAKNIFVNFEPFYELGVNYRKTSDSGVSYNRWFDGSPDEDNCFWITVERKKDDFSFRYNYAKGGSKGNIKRCEKGPEVEADFASDYTDYTTTISIDDMPKDVLVGLAVSTPVSIEDDGNEYYRTFTEAKFEHIALHVD